MLIAAGFGLLLLVAASPCKNQWQFTSMSVVQRSISMILNILTDSKSSIIQRVDACQSALTASPSSITDPLRCRCHFRVLTSLSGDTLEQSSCSLQLAGSCRVPEQLLNLTAVGYMDTVRGIVISAARDFSTATIDPLLCQVARQLPVPEAEDSPLGSQAPQCQPDPTRPATFRFWPVPSVMSHR